MVKDGEPLSEDDARILDLESESITGHTLKLMMLEPGDHPLDLDALRSTVADRLAGQPRATERVVHHADGPQWVHDDAFDIHAHVRRRAANEPITIDQLWRTVSDLMAEHLDHQHPLWTFDVIAAERRPGSDRGPDPPRDGRRDRRSSIPGCRAVRPAN